MIITNLDSHEMPFLFPTQRIREEREGGQLFDPMSGHLSYLSEFELANWRNRAVNDPRIVYFAARNWSTQPLAEGCCSSPVRVYLEVTQSCNLSCIMCYRAAGNKASNELGTLDMLRLIRNLAMRGVHELRITGGEPTTRPDLLELIDAAISNGLYVSLGTNGIWPAGIAASLLKRPIGRYLVSLEGVQGVNDLLRGSGSFAPTIQTIDRLIAAGKSVRVNTMLTRSTLQQLPELVALCAAHHVKYMALIPPRPAGRAVAKPFAAEMPSHKDMEMAAHLVAPLFQEYDVRIEYEYNIYQPHGTGQASDPVLSKVTGCPAGREAAFISPTGWLYACGCSPGGSPNATKRAPFAAGNVAHRDAASIWRAWQLSVVWQPFRDFRKSKDPACFRCDHYGRGCFGSCPVHAYISNGAFNAPDPLCWIRDNIMAHSSEADTNDSTFFNKEAACST